MELKPWKNDVAVLLIFFVRDDVFAKTFEAVRKARPRKLLLWQDGARHGRADDVAGILRCRKIAENIDWECELYRNYQTDNLGCDPSTFYSHKWAFGIVDKCIILEDDCVPEQSFFAFCKILLDKYENDTRINRICGFNAFPPADYCPYDYFFSNTGSVWGWATWKRVADTWDDAYQVMNDEYSMNLLKAKYKDKDFLNDLKKYIRHSETGIPFWESINTFARICNNQVNIISTRSQITNIGISNNATHAPAQMKYMSKRTLKILSAKGEEVSFPMKEPPFVIDDVIYKNKLVADHWFYRKAESIARRLVYGEFKDVFHAFMRFIKIEKNTK